MMAGRCPWAFFFFCGQGANIRDMSFLVADETRRGEGSRVRTKRGRKRVPGVETPCAKGLGVPGLKSRPISETAKTLAAGVAGMRPLGVAGQLAVDRDVCWQAIYS